MGNQRKRWFIWGLAVTAYVIGFFHSLAMGAVHENLVSTFDLTEGTFGQISAAYFYIYLVMQIPSGVLVDLFGPRRTIGYGMLISMIGSFIFASAGTVAALVIGRFIIGGGVSVIFISIMKLLSVWFFEEEFGRMSGLTCFIGTMGGVIAQSPLAIAVNEIGWRGSFLGVGILSGGIGILFLTLLRDPKKKMKGEEIHLRGLMGEMRGIAGNLKTWPPLIVYGGLYGTFVVLTGYWGTDYLGSVYGFSLVEATNYLTVMVLGSAFGAVFIGWISDRLSRRKGPVLIFGIIYAGLWGILALMNGGKPPLPWLLPLFFFLGFFSQGFVLSWALGKEVNNPRFAGMAASIINMGGFLGSVLVPNIVGGQLDRVSQLAPQLKFQNGFVIAFGISILSAVIAFFIRETNCKNL